jgi:hypothetical protein
MSDSNLSDRLASKHEQNRQERLAGIRRWIEYMREQPPEVWGAQQNNLVNSQLESARETALPAEHEQRVRSFAAASSDPASDGNP